MSGLSTTGPGARVSSRDCILRRWLDRVRGGLPKSMDRDARWLPGRMPEFLEHLVLSLGPEGPRLEVLMGLARAHGQQRAGIEGYSLPALLREYPLLREELFQALEQDGPVPPVERDLLLTALEQGMAEAGAGFLQRVQSRAQTPQAQLKAARQDLHEVFMQAPTPMVVLSGPEHRFTLVNHPYEELVRRGVLGKTFAEAFSSEEAAHVLPIIDKVYATGEPHVWPELPLTFADGRQRYLNVSFTPLKDAEGAARAVACLLVDVSEQVEARKTVEESEARFRQIANALPQIVWTATGDFYVDWYNDWWFKYLGMPRGTRWDDSDTLPMHPEDVERTRPKLREAVETGRDFFMEQRFRRGSDGQYRWHLVRGVPIRDAEGRIVKWIGANTDIHDQKTVTARLEEERDLRERFVATLTHDLRTPLTAAKLNAQMVARKASDPTAIYKHAARISENLDRADQMIRDLLDANRIRAGEGLPLDLAECDLAEVARETLEELSLVHGDRFVLCAGGGIRGHWSCEGLRRIIENLCNNAIKYGSREHPVTVTLGGSGPEEVSISVHNWGNPISPEDQRLLFQQYRRIDSAQSRAQKGWGLGLTLVEGLARAHRGAVRVESTREAGTTFTVTLVRDVRQ